MAKVTLNIDDKKLSTVLNILENLKIGLISNIKVENKEHTKSNIQSDKRYLSKDKYKQKLRQKPLDDEFIAKPTTSRYLSPQEFKNRLKKGK